MTDNVIGNFASSTEVQTLLGSGKTEVNVGWFYLVRFLSYTPSIARAARSHAHRGLGHRPVGGFANPGCIVTAWQTQSPFVAPILKRIDAGRAVTLTLPDGSTQTLARQQQNSNYAFSVNDATPGAQLIIPASGGTFRFKAPGGTDVGEADATVAAGNPLVWNEQTTITTVSRSRAPTGEVFTSFGCTVPAEAGRYIVPRDILASMVASRVIGPQNFPTGSLLVEHFTLPARFTVPGLDHGSIIWESYSGTTVHFQ